MEEEEEKGKEEQVVVLGQGVWGEEEKEMNNLISTRMSAMHFVICHHQKTLL